MRRCFDKAAELSRGTTVARKLAKLRDAMNRLLIVAILLISAPSVYAQDQQTVVAKLKADAQKAVSIIKGDKSKTQTFCQMEILGNQVDEAIQKQDTNKAYELTQKLTELQKDLGSEYLALVESLRSLDLTSKDGQQIMSVFDKLDESCPH
jgi:hypothetical protein